jgi:hypothetical protein
MTPVLRNISAWDWALIVDTARNSKAPRVPCNNLAIISPPIENLRKFSSLLGHIYVRNKFLSSKKTFYIAKFNCLPNIQVLKFWII